MKNFRTNEYLIFIYRLFLVYVFYLIARILFFVFNQKVVQIYSFYDFGRLLYYGVPFDTTAILYTNILFILLSILPLWINTRKNFQKIVFYTYFITNGIAYSLNFIDMVYYPFSKARLTTASLDVVKHEQNIWTFFTTFFTMYWYVFLIFAFLMGLWIFLYKRLKINRKENISPVKYFLLSSIVFVVIGVLFVGGVRGSDFNHSTRPINMLDANRHVNTAAQADVILNSPFCIYRTIGKNKGFRIYDFVSQSYINQNVKPMKQYAREVKGKPNVVIFLLESIGREYVGSMNEDRGIKDYRSYTPFLDSLSGHSQIFTSVYSNSRQSIQGISSVLAGVPTFEVAFTSSPYVKQPMSSIASIANEMDYDTSFFHNAPNGSMGFLGFSKIMGYKNYYGKTEYDQKFPNNDDYDGIWGIWDEPFFQYMNDEISQKKQPFMATIFTVSSHHPFNIPEKYKGKFPEGDIPIHKCVAYTDYAIRQFFEKAQKEDWYKNTIFAFIADHPNDVFYELYNQPITNCTVPIIIYSPNNELVGVGKSDEIAQQIDFMPTIADLMGYSKPFRSWGRSLVSEGEQSKAYVTSGAFYQLMQDNYIYQISPNGTVNGIFKREDEALKNNLLGKESNPEIEKGIQDLKAFMQDYMDRLMNKKLYQAE